jgi:hypothetical protein
VFDNECQKYKVFFMVNKEEPWAILDLEKTLAQKVANTKMAGRRHPDPKFN